LDSEFYADFYLSWKDYLILLEISQKIVMYQGIGCDNTLLREILFVGQAAADAPDFLHGQLRQAMKDTPSKL
jgi:hypothetical protein